MVNLQGELYGFGENGNGQLGLNHTFQQYTPVKNKFLEDCVLIATGRRISFVVTLNNSLYGFGLNIVSLNFNLN